MKRLIPVLLVLIPLFTIAQAKKPASIYRPQSNIEGIGPFKINKTTVSFLDILADSLRLERAKTSAIMEYLDMEGDIKLLVEVLPDSMDSEALSMHTSYCADSRSFYISRLTIAGIDLKGILLEFYKGRLYTFQCEENDELTEALTIKYGLPKIIIKDENQTCNGRIYKEQTVEKAWYNKSIAAASHFTSFRSGDNCELNTSSFFLISDEEKFEEWRICDRNGKYAMWDKIRTRKKAALKDL